MMMSATDTLQNLTGRNISDYLVKTYAQIIGKRSDLQIQLSNNAQKYSKNTEILHRHINIQ